MRGSSFRRLASTLSVEMRGAAIRGPVLTDGVGVVERGGHGFNAGDLVHARGLRGTWADRAPLEADATRVVKLPPATPVARAAASFAAAATAYGLLRDVDAGDVVIHLGAEGAVGQCVAQICGARGAKALGLVSGDVLDPEDAVDVLKNLGAVAAAPARFARDPACRALVADLLEAAPSDTATLLVDCERIDVAAVNEVLRAAAHGAGAGRAAMASADARDVRDAKLLRTCAALCGAEATVHAHGAAPEQLLVGGARAFHLDQFLDGASGEMAAVVAAVAKADATVFSEAHSDATLPHALHGLDGTVAKHAYRQPVWLADAP